VKSEVGSTECRWLQWRLCSNSQSYDNPSFHILHVACNSKAVFFFLLNQEHAK